MFVVEVESVLLSAAVVEIKAVLPPRPDAQHVGSSISRQQWPGRLVVANLLKCLLVDQDHWWSPLGQAVASWSSASETSLKARLFSLRPRAADDSM